MSVSKNLIQAIMVTMELTGTELSEAAAKVFAQDLSQFPENQVLPALDRCRRECKGRISLVDVITRINDGRPGPEEAWAMMPKSESDTVVWTTEMCEAFTAANLLLIEGDHVAARMAFLETYKRAVSDARNKRVPVRWNASIGHDPNQREDVIKQATEAGRLTHDQAVTYLPHLKSDLLSLPKKDVMKQIQKTVEAIKKKSNG